MWDLLDYRYNVLAETETKLTDNANLCLYVHKFIKNPVWRSYEILMIKHLNFSLIKIENT